MAECPLHDYVAKLANDPHIFKPELRAVRKEGPDGPLREAFKQEYGLDDAQVNALISGDVAAIDAALAEEPCGQDPAVEQSFFRLIANRWGLITGI